MAKAQTIYITGKAKWAKVYEGQMDTDKRFLTAPNDGTYSIQVAPDEASLIALKAAGSRKQGKKDDAGDEYFSFSRPNKKEFKPGDIQDLGPPKVVTKDGMGEYVPFTEKIGNGSIVTAKLHIYPSRMGVGTRLEAVCVDMHIPYEGNPDEPF